MPGRFFINDFVPVCPRVQSIAEALTNQDSASKLAQSFNRELQLLASMLPDTQLIPLADLVLETGRRNSETIELLMPLPGTVSPISHHVGNGGGAHHICFIVSDIVQAVSEARQGGAHAVVAPTPDAAFEGRLIAFLFDRLYGLVELLESDRRSRNNLIQERPQQVPALLRDNDVEAALAQVFTELFPALRETGSRSGQLEVTQGWDSLGQIRLIMALEQRLGMTIPSNAIAPLVDYDAVVEFITQRSSKLG